MTILESKNLSKTYDSGPEKVRVLEGVNLKIATGEIVAIMGPSGVGKSTLLNLLGTLDQPSGGALLINGEDVFQFNEQRLAKFRNEHIGFIFQFHYLMPEFTALENVLMPRMIRGNDWHSDEQHARKLLTDVGLQQRFYHKPNQLSGGEQQRVAIARAFMNQPKLILADEPTGDLDRKNSHILFDLILELNSKYHQTFVIVTHDDELAHRTHRIIHLLDGKVEREEIVAKN
ncbi:MAG: ABC transporter ATP-binding protein [Calditrichia bacterium]|nr:ABC transporter ATP-binding protein [Calditrichota bacterium]MCB9066557.1 ABC transporter ATP-binding protein [Calditrichia bacterium]